MRRLKLFVFLTIFLLLTTNLCAQTRIHNAGNLSFLVIRSSGPGMGHGLAGSDGRRLSGNFRYPADGKRHYLGMYSDIWVGTEDNLVAAGWNLDGKSHWISKEEINFETSPDGKQSSTANYKATGIDLNVLSTQSILSWSTLTHPEADDFVVIKLTVTNAEAVDLKGIYVAVCADWNIDQISDPKTDFSKDWVDLNKEQKMLYTYDGDDTDGIDPVHAGVVLLDGELATHQIFPIKNRATQKLDTALLVPSYRSPLISDPNRFFRSKVSARTKADLEAFKWSAWDYASIISAGPYNIRAGKAIEVTFALVAGKTKDELMTNTQKAKWITFAPQNVVAERSKRLVKLSWDPAINYVDGYHIRRLTMGEKQPLSLGPRILNGLKYDDATVERGNRYIYTILPVVKNPIDELASTIELSLGSTPDNVTLVDKDQVVMITWEKPLYEPAGYHVLRKTAGESSFRQITPQVVRDNAYADVEVKTGVEYHYQVRPLDEAMQPLPFDSDTVRILPVFPPSRLYSDQKTDPDSITIHWTLVSERIAGYNVYRSYNGIAPWVRIANISKEQIQHLKTADRTEILGDFSVVDQTELHFTDLNVYDRSAYYYSVTALNQEDRESQMSAPTERINVSSVDESSTEINLSRVFAYPNPLNLLKHDQLTFTNLMGQVIIRIYTPVGDLIRKIDHIEGTSRVGWDGKNEEGNLVRPGIYMYHIETLNPEIVGKISTSGSIAIVR